MLKALENFGEWNAGDIIPAGILNEKEIAHVLATGLAIETTPTTTKKGEE